MRSCHRPSGIVACPASGRRARLSAPTSQQRLNRPSSNFWPPRHWRAVRSISSLGSRRRGERSPVALSPAHGSPFISGTTKPRRSRLSGFDYRGPADPLAGTSVGRAAAGRAEPVRREVVAEMNLCGKVPAPCGQRPTDLASVACHCERVSLRGNPQFDLAERCGGAGSPAWPALDDRHLRHWSPPRDRRPRGH